MSHQEAEKRIVDAKKGHRAKFPDSIQLVRNYNPYPTPGAKPMDLKLGEIPNFYAALQVAPVHSLGEGSWAQWIQTRGAQEDPSPKCLRTR